MNGTARGNILSLLDAERRVSRWARDDRRLRELDRKIVLWLENQRSGCDAHIEAAILLHDVILLLEAGTLSLEAER